MTMMVMMITYDDAAGTRHPYEADTEAEVDEVEEEDDGGDDDNDDDSDAESSLISAQDMGTCRHCQIAPRTWGLAAIAKSRLGHGDLPLMPQLDDNCRHCR